MNRSGMLELDSDSNVFKDFMHIPLDERLTTSDVADYFPEFENNYGRVDMRVIIKS